MARGIQDEERMVAPVYKIRGLKGRIYLLGQYLMFWIDQKATSIALELSRRNIKLIFFAFNSLSMISALTVLILSLINDEYNDYLAGIALQAAGNAVRNQDALSFMNLVAVIFTALYGYFCLLKENRRQIVNFTVLCAISLIFNFIMLVIQLIGAMELYFGIIFFPMESLNANHEEYTIPEFWHELQIQGECCGFNGPEDWGPSIPDSCCHLLHGVLKEILSAGSSYTYTKCTKQEVFQRGCKFIFYKRTIWPAVILAIVIGEALSFLAGYFYYYALIVTRGYLITT